MLRQTAKSVVLFEFTICGLDVVQALPQIGRDPLGIDANNRIEKFQRRCRITLGQTLLVKEVNNRIGIR